MSLGLHCWGPSRWQRSERGVGRPCISVTQATPSEQTGAVAWSNFICGTSGRLPGSVFVTQRVPQLWERTVPQRPGLHIVEGSREEAT